MRVAIIGAGFGLTGHLPAFMNLPNVEVMAVADSGSGRVRDALPSNVGYLDSWQKVLELPLDSVSIVVPPAQQCEIVSAALRQEKHVFCDKPFGFTLKDARAMNVKAKEHFEFVTAINYQFRFELGIQELKRQIDLGVIGDVRSIDFSWMTGGRASPNSVWTWRNDHLLGGGVIGAFFSHAADLIWWLTQKEPMTILGRSRIIFNDRPDELGQRRRVTAEDIVTAELICEDDVSAHFRVSNCQEGGNGMRIEVFGSDGVIVFSHEPPFQLEDQCITFSSKGRKRHVPIVKPKQYVKNADTRIWALQESASRFVRKVHGDLNACGASFQDGLRVHKVMDGLRRSIIGNKEILL